jgi:pimeloyl-ACP methyl ester carboxylesterase
MPQATLTNGVTLEYETMGDPSHPTLLWIMGFTAQLVAWPDELMQMFVDRGFHVVRFDNRDCGLSTKLDGVHVDTAAVTAAAVMEQPVPPVPYTLSDMAADAAGLLEHLGIARAHVVGASMGGMIAQTFAIEHRERLASLVSIMSMPGDLGYGQPTPEAMEALLAPPAASREEFLAGAHRWSVWCSKKHFDLDEARRRAAREYDRMYYPEGAGRQLAAIYASGNRSDALARLDAPTLVIHGRDDTLIAPSGGERTSELVAGSVLMMVADMGHDLPMPLWPLYADAIASHARRADGHG